jgi:hypothetical protein
MFSIMPKVFLLGCFDVLEKESGHSDQDLMSREHVPVLVNYFVPHVNYDGQKIIYASVCCLDTNASHDSTNLAFILNCVCNFVKIV